MVEPMDQWQLRLPKQFIGTIKMITISVHTSDSANQGPFMGGVVVAQYPYCLHCPAKKCGNSITNCCGTATEQLELIFKVVPF